WIEGADDPTTSSNYKLYHWMSPDIKIRMPGMHDEQHQLASDPITFLDFGFKVDESYAPDHFDDANSTGTNEVYVEVHNRGLTPPTGNVSVLLLWTPGSAALPLLPSDFAQHINLGHTHYPEWLGENWHFVDTSTPYHTLLGNLDPRTPLVAGKFPLTYDSTTMGTLEDHICLVAFVTSQEDPIEVPSIWDGTLDDLVMK